MLKCIIFDFDGVLMDNYEKHYELCTQKYKGITREEHKQLFDGNIHLQREKLKSRETDFDLHNAMGEYKSKASISPHIKKNLQILAQKFQLGIISSAREAGLQGFLKNNQIEKLFTFVYGFETHKLKGEKFKLVFDEYKLTPRECIFITDTLGDILEAKSVNIQTIALECGYHERERLEKGKPLKIVTHFEEIVAAVNEVSKLKH
ncbi:HAD family hydrolase [Candidatus Woesearchaeota archaeon]|nr:HAD family hydrolase [Candidatus Woesearchaeota archaeon]